MEYVDTLPDEVIEGIISPDNAVLAGKMQVSDVEEVRRFDKVFPFDPVKVIEVAQRHSAVMSKAGGPTPKEKFDVVFTELLPECFDEKAASGWNAVLHFEIDGADDYTVQVANGTATTSIGLEGEATCEVTTDAETFSSVLRFNTLDDAASAYPEPGSDGTRARTALKAVGEAHDEELSDEMLEAVAGGKGCGAEGSAASACGADGCGAAAGAGNACGAAACGADAGIGNACGAAACGAAVGIGTVCGADACPAAAGVGTACGAAAGVGACAGDVCGAAVGAGVCAGNVCGIDVLGGADIGPCGINVIPLVPGC